MITGCAQADVAVLMLDASLGSFENGFMGDGQTKERMSLDL
jgi:elongation factor 1 alpha-like protein